MITVTPRARRHDDRAGDPLDGLVNLFDLGIVLAVAFLLAALSSLNLTKAVTQHGLTQVAPDTIQITPGQTVHTLPTPGATTIGHGSPVGTVYQLPDGRLIYVTGPGATAGTTAAPSGAPSGVPTGGSTTQAPTVSPSPSGSP